MSSDGDDMVVGGSDSGILDDGRRKRAVACLVDFDDSDLRNRPARKDPVVD